jgi:hypothetical protein
VTRALGADQAGDDAGAAAHVNITYRRKMIDRKRWAATLRGARRRPRVQGREALYYATRIR